MDIFGTTKRMKSYVVIQSKNSDFKHNCISANVVKIAKVAESTHSRVVSVVR